PNSPSFGCFDRNFWHYRMRDFSSIILQQGGYTALRASEAVPDFLPGCFARELAAGSAKFWNRRAVMHGAFEEYYPWEQGYPPVAFSTLAVAKLVAEGVVDKDAVRPGMKRAARQLLARFEDKATNQQVAGLAALAWIRKSYPESVPEAGFARQKAKTLAKQHEEGWFWEYDGPDAGYLSVTMDCLWDLWDATGDPDFRDSCNRALAFLDTAVGKPGCGLGMLNARNTDYVVPYGIARYLNDGAPEQRRTAGRLIDALYSGAGEAAHFFAAVDDRYWCHYIGHSVARAVAQFDKAAARSPAETLPPESGRAAADVFLPGCGYAFRRLPDETLLTVAANKGGCLRLSKHGKVLAADFGWVVKTREKQFVSHWWSTDWKTKRTAGGYEISGRLAPHREMESTPFKHFGLRVVSYLFGKSVIGLLKKNLIFKKTESPYGFKRVVAVGEDGSVLVDDSISGLTGAESVLPAPRASKRHVASADSFHAEDAALIADGVSFSRETHSGGGTFRAKTKVAFENP
ncbi:MAG: hypothetical protein IJ678_06290, partial [Kiritimatiellae bacterium]|nr:hypothetical protein [Kiritimatiellia bacterium]